MHIIAPFMSCVVTPAEFADAVTQGYKEIYILTTKGIMKHHIIRGVNRFIRLKVDTIPGYQEVEIKEAMNFLPAGKIPYAIFEQVEAFFRKVMEVHKSDVEAMIHVLWNAERGYHLGVPPQTVSKASVSYDWSYVPSGTSIIVDIHSHNTMGAFFSGVDNNDDRNNISFSGVFGGLQHKAPETKWRFNYFAQKFDAKTDDIFELPQIQLADVPSDWLGQIKLSTYQYKGGNSNQGNVHKPGTGGSKGKSWEHLKQHQFPKGTAGQHGKPLALPNGSQNTGLNGPDVELPDAGLQGEFFDHADHALVQAELDEYYESLGIVPHDGPTPRPKAKNDFDDSFYYDVEKGRYVMKEGVDVTEDMIQEAEAALARVTEDPAANESHLGKTGVETLNSSHRSGLDSTNTEPESMTDQDPKEMLPGYTDGRYEELAATEGVEVADAWFSINQEMGWLDGKDEINTELIVDMFNLTSEEGQSSLIRELFLQLSPAQQEKIQTYGF
jgi:PRTRC genetic system protein A